MKRVISIIFAWSLLLLSVLGIIALGTQDSVEQINYANDVYGRRLALLNRLQTLPEREDEISERLDDLGMTAAEQYLYSGDANIVRSLVQRDIRSAAAQSGVELRSVRAVANLRQVKPLRYSSVSLQFYCHYEELLKFLQNLQVREPILKIRRISVRVRRVSTETSDAELNVTMEIAGYSKLDDKDV